MRQINEIIIHCTATRPKWWDDKSPQEKVEEIRRWHVEDNKWQDIGYHYLIDRGGEVIKGRPVQKVGAHVKGHNSGTIGISLFGGHGSTAEDNFEDNFTKPQEQSLRQLICDLRKKYQDINKISGHNQYAARACPGFSVPDWFAQKPASGVRTPVAPQGRTNPAQSRTLRASLTSICSAIGAAVTAVAALDSTAQYIVIGFTGVSVLMALWIMRERLRKWGLGDR